MVHRNVWSTGPGDRVPGGRAVTAGPSAPSYGAASQVAGLFSAPRAAGPRAFGVRSAGSSASDVARRLGCRRAARAQAPRAESLATPARDSQVRRACGPGGSAGLPAARALHSQRPAQNPLRQPDRSAATDAAAAAGPPNLAVAAPARTCPGLASESVSMPALLAAHGQATACDDSYQWSERGRRGGGGGGGGGGRGAALRQDSLTRSPSGGRGPAGRPVKGGGRPKPPRPGRSGSDPRAAAPILCPTRTRLLATMGAAAEGRRIPQQRQRPCRHRAQAPPAPSPAKRAGAAGSCAAAPRLDSDAGTRGIARRRLPPAGGGPAPARPRPAAGLIRRLEQRDIVEL